MHHPQQTGTQTKDVAPSFLRRKVANAAPDKCRSSERSAWKVISVDRQRFGGQGCGRAGALNAEALSVTRLERSRDEIYGY